MVVKGVEELLPSIVPDISIGELSLIYYCDPEWNKWPVPSESPMDELDNIFRDHLHISPQCPSITSPLRSLSDEIDIATSTREYIV